MTANLLPLDHDPIALETPAGSDNPALVYLAGLASPQSRRTMATALNTIAELAGADPVWQSAHGRNGWRDVNLAYASFPWAALRFQHTQAIRSKLAEMYAPATANKMLSALRGVLGAAWELGLMSAEEYHRAIRLKVVKGETLPAGREIEDGEIKALLKACRGDPKQPITPGGARDAAILALLWAGGLRRSEVAALNRADFNLATGELRIKAGKGHKDRIVWVANGALSAMADWLVFRGDDAGPLFCAVNKGNRIIRSTRLGPQGIYSALAKRAEEASVNTLSPHDFRRTYVGNLLEAGADIATVAKLAGHASVTTTARYDRRPEEAKRQAAGRLHFPWRRAITLEAAS